MSKENCGCVVGPCGGTGAGSTLRSKKSVTDFPDDVRTAAIASYMTALSVVEPVSGGDSIKLQKERLEALADNIIAGYARLIGD